MIVAGPEGFRKNQYRKFNIRSADLTPGDDFGMMREVLARRFKRLLAESAARALAAPPWGERAGAAERSGGRVERRLPSSSPTLPARGDGESAARDEHAESPWPDLVLIDGGQGQLTAAREV